MTWNFTQLYYAVEMILSKDRVIQNCWANYAQEVRLPPLFSHQIPYTMSNKFKKQLQELDQLMKVAEQIRKETRMEQARMRAHGVTKLVGILDKVAPILIEPMRNNDIRLNTSVHNVLRNNRYVSKGKKLDILENVETLNFV